VGGEGGGQCRNRQSAKNVGPCTFTGDAAFSQAGTEGGPETWIRANRYKKKNGVKPKKQRKKNLRMEKMKGLPAKKPHPSPPQSVLQRGYSDCPAGWEKETRERGRRKIKDASSRGASNSGEGDCAVRGGKDLPLICKAAKLRIIKRKELCDRGMS